MFDLTLPTQSFTVIKDIEILEPIHVDSIDKLIQSDLLKNDFNNKYMKEFYKHERDQLKAFKSKIDQNGFALVKYNRKNFIGRSNPVKGLGLFNIRREIRQTLVKDLLVDIDIVNCHPVILSQICKQNNISCNYLNEYIQNRDKIIQEHMQQFNISKDEAKRIFIAGCYCGNFILESRPSDFYNEFVSEMRKIAKVITSANPEIEQMVKTNDPNKVNINGSVLSHYLQEIEHNILDKVYNYCVENNFIRKVEDKPICSLQADGIMIEKELYREELLNQLSNLIKTTFDLNLQFVEKKFDQFYNMDEVTPIDYNEPKLVHQIPNLSKLPSVTGNDKYLSNIFTLEHYKQNDVIILNSCCGTGKTYSVAKYISEAKDKVLSIVNRIVLTKAQIKEFNRFNVKIADYQDKENYDLKESGIICLNSIMKYSRCKPTEFKDFVVYIDEIQSFVETFTHSEIMAKDIRIITETLFKIIMNCKKLIVSDHTILDNIFIFLENRIKKKGKTVFIKNNYLKFDGVESLYVHDENEYLNKLIQYTKTGNGYFAGFDSATKCENYFYKVKELLSDQFNDKFVLITADNATEAIPDDLAIWKDKFVFFSPKIETGLDFSIDTKQTVFYHMNGNSVLPSSSFQQICRTRNMKNLIVYAREYENLKLYKPLEAIRNNLREDMYHLNIYGCCHYMDIDGEFKFVDNSFFKLYSYNEYLKGIYASNKKEHLKQILIDNGFKLKENLVQENQGLEKATSDEMKCITEAEIDEKFNKWVDGEILDETFQVRCNLLCISEKKEKRKFKNFIVNKQNFEGHYHTICLLKDQEFIKEKLKDKIVNSYFNIGIQNVFSKIKLLHDFEREMNIKRFDFDGIKEGIELKDNIWFMVKKLFGKRNSTKKPETINDYKKHYASMINNIVPGIVDSKRVSEGGREKNIRYQKYFLNNELLKNSYKLDKVKDKSREDYDLDVVERLGLKLPKVKEVECEDYEFNDYGLDEGL